MGFFVPQSSLVNLKNYKYSSEDRSIVTKYILKPFWTKFALIFPTWMAPNLVTLLGFCFILINVATTLYYDPSLTQESPRWTYFSYALGLFLYQTFDACDGMHARRTGQSGPLGELFDHCVDSLNTTLSILPFCSAMGMGYTHILIFAQFSCLCNFYLSTWEEFHTHKLFLSEFSGPVEGILGLVGFFILTGIFGQDAIWNVHLFDITLFVNKPFNVTTSHALIYLIVIGIIFNIISARRNVIEYYEKNTPSENRTAIEKNINNAFKGLLPFILFYIPVFFLISIQPNFINLPFILSIGFTMAFVVGRIIVGHLTQQHYPMINPPMFLPVLQIATYLFMVNGLNYEQITVSTALSWFGFGLSVGMHAFFINEIIYEFTTYLDMYALSIKHPKKLS
ncbi:hypothetical protein TBLA_0D00380 [Henningerozyma blattae CBS 6284]|uniref:diacylglycerol cholinephosphotransferase n=1 Tax=Henningerozyma blattae (strain ATCC 34711 / CBS 6284 / DSM 70876 / NBRC 10599 / NRRL Y-10934 / UCD 77-7) TaxID=1071380 RepID=I2H2E6_HENB6|nr:hypothetical protein TBLA_0D00380 [Tetrapisispora blattae CBS 6284]CCH60548.1 hypothetical protein TBLA_0D00380 [Tetrapisispora blattae CBS 6284]